MDKCIFCSGPCRGNVCEDCFDEIAELAPKAVIDRLTSSIASRVVELSKSLKSQLIVEDLEEE